MIGLFSKYQLFGNGSLSISFTKYLFYACAKLDALIIKAEIDHKICTIWVRYEVAEHSDVYFFLNQYITAFRSVKNAIDSVIRNICEQSDILIVNYWLFFPKE